MRLFRHRTYYKGFSPAYKEILVNRVQGDLTVYKHNVQCTISYVRPFGTLFVSRLFFFHLLLLKAFLLLL